MTFFSWSKWTRIKPSPSFSSPTFCNLFMSFKCPVPYASRPGEPLPYGLGLGDNIKMSSNKHICVCCTIWPSDACVVDLSYLGPVIWSEWCKPIIQERPLCRPHLVGECGTWWRWMLGALKSLHWSFGVRPPGLVPVLRHRSAQQVSRWPLPASGEERNVIRSVMWPLDIDPPSGCSHWQMVGPNISGSET